MRILWLTNKLIPRVSIDSGLKSSNVNEGWISNVFEKVVADDRIKLTILCGYESNEKGNTSDYGWYTFKESSNEEIICSPSHVSYFEDVIKDVRPDVIHIWGSEYPHALAMAKAASGIGCLGKVVVWLQGLISACSLPYYFYANLPSSELKRQTVFDRFMGTSTQSLQKKYQKRGAYEMELLNMIKHVIGRTEWDKRYTLLVNPDINYHHCNETMREVFYDGEWSFEKCIKHSIFVTQANYSLKGFHLLIEAVALLKVKFPDLIVRVAGYDITDMRSLGKKMKAKSYGKFLRELINKYHFDDCIFFLGKLDAKRMKQLYLDSNVVACCSSIENSSNTVSEAMLLGVPVVSSKVGGIPSLMSDDEGFLYQWNDIDGLSDCIERVFINHKLACEKAGRARKHAMTTHDAVKNYSSLLEIYNTIDSLNKEKKDA